MKPRAKPVEPLFDPILDELYRARDAYARMFNFDIDAICDALARSAHPPVRAGGSPASQTKTTRHRAGAKRASGRSAIANKFTA